MPDPRVGGLCRRRQVMGIDLLKLGRQCKQSLESDLADFIAAQEQRLVSAAMNGVDVETYAATKFFRTTSHQPRMLPASLDGVPAITKQMGAANVKEYLAQLMSGVCDTFEQHLGLAEGFYQ